MTLCRDYKDFENGLQSSGFGFRVSDMTALADASGWYFKPPFADASGWYFDYPNHGGNSPAAGSLTTRTLVICGWSLTSSHGLLGRRLSRFRTPIASPPGCCRPTFIWAMLTPCLPKIVPMKPIRPGHVAVA